MNNVENFAYELEKIKAKDKKNTILFAALVFMAIVGVFGVLSYLLHFVDSRVSSIDQKTSDLQKQLQEEKEKNERAKKNSEDSLKEAKEAKKEVEIARADVTSAKKDVEVAKSKLSQALADAEYQKRTAETLVEQIKNFHPLSESINDQEKIASLVESSLLKNKEFFSAVKKWPDGSYCILSNGQCPSGFTKSEGFLKAISVYPEGDSSWYLNPSSPKIGDTFIQCHGPCRKYGQWSGEVIISTCCK